MDALSQSRSLSEVDQLSDALDQARSTLLTANVMGTIFGATDAEIVRVIKQSQALIRETKALLVMIPAHQLDSHDAGPGELGSPTR